MSANCSGSGRKVVLDFLVTLSLLLILALLFTQFEFLDFTHGIARQYFDKHNPLGVLESSEPVFEQGPHTVCIHVAGIFCDDESNRHLTPALIRMKK